MAATQFHAYYKACELSDLSGNDKFVPIFSSSDIEIYPYQISAAMFAMRSPFLKGVILADDGSLGKSIEAMLIITQKWYEGKQNILIVVPVPLLGQWIEIIESKFAIPFFILDSNITFREQLNSGNENPFNQEGIVITTYDFALEKTDYLSRLNWNLTVFEEAHHLKNVYKAENKGARAIREAVKESFKILLTATPMQTDIMDLYGLIYFIDEAVLPDADSFS